MLFNLPESSRTNTYYWCVSLSVFLLSSIVSAACNLQLSCFKNLFCHCDLARDIFILIFVFVKMEYTFRKHFSIFIRTYFKLCLKVSFFLQWFEIPSHMLKPICVWISFRLSFYLIVLFIWPSAKTAVLNPIAL